MALSPRLELRQVQRLSMTPQLRQAIGLLQMTTGDLVALLEKEAEKNPLLEFVAPKDPAQSKTAAAQRTPVGAATLAGSGDFTPEVPAEHNLRDDLTTQILMSERDEDVAALACRLIGELDENGFLRTQDLALSENLGVPVTLLEKAVAVLQSCEPVGVGARDLTECLSIQLRDSGAFDPVMQALVGNLDMLANGNFSALARQLGIGVEQLDAAIARLQATNPRPVAQYDMNVIQSAVPDILVSRNPAGGWRVELNTDVLPRILVNESYASEVSDKNSREFIAECRRNAHFLVRAMDRRAKTILRVATVVVRHQSRFFDEGVTGLRPLNLSVVADELGLHKATVSRVTNGKYLECPRGNFGMRFFFPQGVSGAAGAQDMAAPIVRERIRRIVASETGRTVFSDQRIAKILSDEGVDIARRTVAKYRMSMGIPSSSQRRRKRS